MTLLLDVPATAKLLGSKWTSLSWSKMTTFNKCTMSWFRENYAVPLDQSGAYYQDGAAAISGSIIQRVWEAVINGRIFRTAPSPEALAKWMAEQSRALYYATVLPLESQADLSRDLVRQYFRTAVGKEHLQRVQHHHGLHDTFLKGLKPQFTDLTKFGKTHGGLDKFVATLEQKYLTMLRRFAALDVDFNRMLSEQFVRAKFDGSELVGSIDFLYNTKPMTTEFALLSQLDQEFIILDGKNQIGPYTSVGQLYFYATVLHIAYRKLPSYVGFIDWSKSDFVWYPVDLTQIEKIKRAVRIIMGVAAQVNDSVQTRRSQHSVSYDLKDTPYLTFNPSKMNCRFCSIVRVCDAAKNAGSQPGPDAISFVRAVPEGLDVAGLDGGITDVDL